MKTAEKIFDILVEKHGDRLDLNEGQEYFLFFNDGYAKVSVNDEEEAVQLEVCGRNKNLVFAYHTDQSVRELVGK